MSDLVFLALAYRAYHLYLEMVSNEEFAALSKSERKSIEQFALTGKVAINEFAKLELASAKIHWKMHNPEMLSPELQTQINRWEPQFGKLVSYSFVAGDYEEDDFDQSAYEAGQIASRDEPITPKFDMLLNFGTFNVLIDSEFHIRKVTRNYFPEN